MVYFTCNHCGDSVKKPNVDKHYMTKCRNKAKSVSCMDCQKDFYAEDYVGHTSCITEAEKYSGNNYVPKTPKFAGKKKQENWSETIRSILHENKYPLTQSERSLFKRLQNFENVPRKKEKFQNFVVNCLKIKINEANSIWNILEMELQKLQQNKAQNKTADDKKNDVTLSPNVKKSCSKLDNKTEAKLLKKIKKEIDHDENNEAKSKDKQKGTEDHEPLLKKFKNEIDHDENNENNERDKTQNITNGNELVIANDGNQANELSVALGKIVGKHIEGITIDKLKKKFLKKYKRKLQLDELTEKQDKKFQKKFRKLLHASASIRLDGDIVKPVK